MRMQRLELAQDRDQRLELGLADALRNVFLRALPIGLRSLERLGALGRQGDLARACVTTRRDCDPFSFDKRIEVALLTNAAGPHLGPYLEGLAKTDEISRVYLSDPDSGVEQSARTTLGSKRAR